MIFGIAAITLMAKCFYDAYRYNSVKINLTEFEVNLSKLIKLNNIDRATKMCRAATFVGKLAHILLFRANAPQALDLAFHKAYFTVQHRRSGAFSRVITFGLLFTVLVGITSFNYRIGQLGYVTGGGPDAELMLRIRHLVLLPGLLCGFGSLYLMWAHDKFLSAALVTLISIRNDLYYRAEQIPPYLRSYEDMTPADYQNWQEGMQVLVGRYGNDIPEDVLDSTQLPENVFKDLEL